MGLRRFFYTTYTTYTHHPRGLPRSSVADCFSNQTPRRREWIHSDRRDAAGSLPSTLKMAGTCLGTTAAPLCTMHIYVLIALRPARSINVLLFQLPEWQKYEMLPVSSGVHLFVRHANDVGCHTAHQETRINQKPCHYFHGIDVTKHCERHLQNPSRVLGTGWYFRYIHLSVNLDFEFMTQYLTREGDIEAVYMSCIFPDCLISKCGPGGWNPMFPRRVDKKCQEETCTFKGQATGKGLWEGFCTAVAALCQGLLSPPVPPIPKHPKKKIRSFSQSKGWHRCCTVSNSSLRVGIRINNETILSSCMLGHLQQQPGAVTWHFGEYAHLLSCQESKRKYGPFMDYIVMMLRTTCLTIKTRKWIKSLVSCCLTYVTW